MGLKIFGVGGIDQKTNHLLRNPKHLRDSRNIKYNIHKEYVERPSVSVDTAFDASYLADKIKSNVIYIKSLDQYFFSDGFNYKIVKNGVVKTLPGIIGTDVLNTFEEISSCEYLNSLILTHTKTPSHVIKYDGNYIYKAGLPTPKINSYTSGTGYIIAFFEFTDHNGITFFGPWKLIKNADISSQVINFDNMYDTGFFSQDFIRMPLDAGTNYIINKTNRTLTNIYSHGYSTGDKVIIRTNSLPFCSTLNENGVPLIHMAKYNLGTIVDFAVTSTFNDNFIILEIESITGDGTPGNYFNITFTEESFKEISINITVTDNQFYNIVYNTVLRLFTSTQEATGYEGFLNSGSIKVLNNVIPFGVYTTNLINIRTLSLTYTTDITLMSDIYDITTSKLRPPKCRYITTFGDQIVCGSILAFFDFNNKENSYRKNDDLIMYSDISNGDLGLNFSEINRQIIGDTYDGSVTGMIRSKDSLLVFKERSIYAIDGVLVTGSYNLRKIETSGIGCGFFQSIAVTDGYISFHGQDGIYNTNGFVCKRMSMNLDVFFRSTDPYKTRALVDIKNRMFMFFTDKGVAVFDTENSEWFIWDSRNEITNNDHDPSLLYPSKGLIIDNSNKIISFTNNAAMLFNDESILNDNYGAADVAIYSYIKTHWFDLLEPSLLKKATDLRLFSLNNGGQVLSLKTYTDWNESNVKQMQNIDMDINTKTILRKLDIQQSQSISLEISNSNLDESMNISGYELLIDVIQKRDKNVK